ncbi:MAG: SRPBCC family protein [Acidimicrobiales bacterium]|jgi:hypothetical protein|nr:SRPBCC family protein [Acidimicrobiales bacterium]
MATIRHHARIAKPADEVWAVVRDTGDIAEWFPAIDASSQDGDVRICSMMGLELKEEIVTNDDELRRLQYRIVEAPLPIEFHLATVDVFEDGKGSLVVYSTDVQPDDLGPVISPSLADGVAGLKAFVER